MKLVIWRLTSQTFSSCAFGTAALGAGCAQPGEQRMNMTAGTALFIILTVLNRAVEINHFIVVYDYTKEAMV